MNRLLVAETDEGTCAALRAHYANTNTSIVRCTTEEEILLRVREGVQAVLLSRVADGTELEILRELKLAMPTMPVVTLVGTAEEGLRALRLGASYVSRRTAQLDEVVLLLDRVMRDAGGVRELEGSTGPGAAAPPVLIGESSAIRSIRDTVRRLSSSPTTAVLLTGESGVGKDTIARALHAVTSPDRPMVYVSPATLREPLLELKLFGSEEHPDKPSKVGLLDQAAGGTLFIDDLADVPRSLHHKFLRFLEEKTYRPLGSVVERRCDMRVVASTQWATTELFTQGPIAPELLYRLAVVLVEVPPLRARPGDIPLLAQHFVADLGRRLRRPHPTIAPAAMQRLEAHSWPGNVRELRNVLERAVLVGGGSIVEPSHVVFPVQPHRSSGTYRLPPEGIDFSSLERDVLGQALTLANGNQRQAARLLGMTRDQIRYRMAKFALSYAPSRTRSNGAGAA